MTLEKRAPTPVAGSRSFLTAIRQLLTFSSPNPMEHEDEQKLRQQIISVAVSESQQDGIFRKDGSVIVTFSQSPHDVTAYVKEKSPYPDDTSGGFSDVYKCVLEKPGEPSAVVAVKALRLAINDAKAMQGRGKKLRAEVHIWIRLDHPNVLKLYGMTDGFARLPALVSPWVENGTLNKYLEGPGREISKGARVSILIKVGEALDYIHSQYVVHGDLTGSNVLINGDGQPMISDFGLSSILEEFNKTTYFKSHRTGAVRWVAPELLGEVQPSPSPSVKSDIYSYGCVMLHALSGKIPYSESQEYHIPYAKISGVLPQRPTARPIGDSHWEMIERCLDGTPGNRPKLPDIVGFLNSLTFSQQPQDLTQYIGGKPPYPDNTGKFSDVYKCVLDIGKPGTVVAVKALRLPGGEVLEERGKKLRAEVHIWIRLDHPNVLKLYGIADGFARLPALVSPWVENGTLTRYLEGPGEEISKGARISILIKVGEALNYIHSEHVVHGDLTGSNVLINGDGQPLISDFGLSSILKDHDETSYFKSHTPGAFRWVAPELFTLETSPMPSNQSDIYSYGCVMLHTLSGKVPYSEIRDFRVPQIKISGRYPQRPTDLPIEEAHWEMIKTCLDATPGNRPKLPDIISFLSRQGKGQGISSRQGTLSM